MASVDEWEPLAEEQLLGEGEQREGKFYAPSQIQTVESGLDDNMSWAPLLNDVPLEHLTSPII